ncbi:MAG: hypothetical protein V3U16_03835, partial [Candidatus Neomarinimicrobiota bacterium]
MLKLLIRVTVLLQSLWMVIEAQQIVAVSDTITLQITSNQVQLKSPILGNSFSIKINNTIIKNYSLDPVKGILIIAEPFNAGDSLIVHYNRLTTPIPLRVGLIPMNFPHLDSLSSHISLFEERSNSSVRQPGI